MQHLATEAVTKSLLSLVQEVPVRFPLEIKQEHMWEPVSLAACFTKVNILDFGILLPQSCLPCTVIHTSTEWMENVKEN